MNLFFYGTLRHLPLLEVVLGTAVKALDVTPADLPDHTAMGVRNAPFPMIVAAQGQSAAGVLVMDLTDAQIARLNFYEGGFDYDLRLVTLADGQGAHVYFPAPGAWTPDGPWSLDRWAAQWAEMTVIAAREVMGHYGHRTAQEVADMFEMIRARATAQVHGARSRHGAGTLDGTIDVIERRRAYTGFYALDEFTLRHQTFAGGTSPILERSAFIATDAAIVLPYDPVRDRVLLVEQMRLGPLARGDRCRWQMEPIAGRVDAGETPVQAAHREASEEAGLTLSALQPVAETYASPGNSTEFHYIYIGIADLPDRAHGLGGKADEAEDIRSHIITFDAMMTMIDDFQAANAPLIVAALWLSKHRARLRKHA